MKTMIVASVIAFAALPLAAQTIWRCGPDGRTFQATPCTGGQTLALAPGPTAAAVAEAQAVGERERQALTRLAADRRAREREAMERGLGPAGIEPLPLPPEKPAPRRKPVKPLPWQAAG